MRSAARQPEPGEPGPDLAEVAAKAGAVLDAMLGTARRAADTLAAWDTGCPQDPRAVPVLQGLSTEIIGAGLHCEELRREVAALAAGLGSLEQAFAAGRAHERSQAQQQAPPAPPAGPRHAAGKRLRLVGGSGVAAFAGAAFAGLRHALIAHPAVAAAAGVTAVAATTTAVLVPSPSPSASAVPAGTPAPAASVYDATPVPPGAQKLIASVSGRKGGKGLTVAMEPPFPSYAPPDPSVPAADPGPPPAPAAGQLSVSVTALNLGTAGTGVLTLSCTGGPCSWHVLPGRHVSADIRQGALRDGQSVTVSLSVNPAALILGGRAVTRVWPGDITVPVSWDAPPVQVPTVDPSASALPTVAGI